MQLFTKFAQLFQNYFLARIGIGCSTASFWYIKAKANIIDKECFERYKKPGILPPFYLFDYRRKLKFKHVNKDGIVVLPYKGTIGDQINPEAAFQYALGLHDAYLVKHDQNLITRFLQYADYFLGAQTKDGDWLYQFDWYGLKAPWASALAQSRGASVMLRAWMLTKNTKYLDGAKLALSKFNLAVEQGGYLAFLQLTNCYYYDEYPGKPNAVLNGYMASLFGIWEMAYWTNEKQYWDLWQRGIESLRKMLPFYTTKHWTLYDQLPFGRIKNYNSAFYHNMVKDYALILAILAADTEIMHYHLLWQKQDKLINRIFFSLLKIIRKVFYH